MPQRRPWPRKSVNALDADPRPQGDRAHVRVRVQRPAAGHPADRRGACACSATSWKAASARPAVAIRVTAQLITAADGSHLWSERDHQRDGRRLRAPGRDRPGGRRRAAGHAGSASPASPAHAQAASLRGAALRGRHHMLRSYAVDRTRAPTTAFEQAMAVGSCSTRSRTRTSGSQLLRPRRCSRMRSLRRRPCRWFAPRAKEALDPRPVRIPGPHSLLACRGRSVPVRLEEPRPNTSPSQLAGASVSADAHWAYASLYLQPLGRFQRSRLSHGAMPSSATPLNAHVARVQVTPAT